MTEQSFLLQWRGQQAEQGLLYQKHTLSPIYLCKKTHKNPYSLSSKRDFNQCNHECKSINFRKVNRFPFWFTLHVYQTLHLFTKNLLRRHSVKSFRCFWSINNSQHQDPNVLYTWFLLMDSLRLSYFHVLALSIINTPV